MAAPRSVGPAVFLRSPPTQNILGPSWSVRRHGRSQCGTRGFPGLTANPHTLSLLECTAHGRSSQCGTCGLLGLTANPQHLGTSTSAVDVNLNQGFVPRPCPRWGNGHSRAQPRRLAALNVLLQTDCVANENRCQ